MMLLRRYIHLLQSMHLHQYPPQRSRPHPRPHQHPPPQRPHHQQHRSLVDGITSSNISPLLRSTPSRTTFHPSDELPQIQEHLLFDGLELGNVPHALKLNNLPPWQPRRHGTSFEYLTLRKSPPTLSRLPVDLGISND